MDDFEDKFTPKEAVKKYCIQCLGLTQFNRDTVENCQGDKAFAGPCPLFPYRLGEKRISVKTFRRYCLYCTQGDRLHVDGCAAKDCTLYPYRYGKNPACSPGRANNFKKAAAV